jgi:hypothetical protein
MYVRYSVIDARMLHCPFYMASSVGNTTLAAKRLVQVTALNHPTVALAMFVATATVPVGVPSVIAGASSVLESTERVTGEIAASK